MGISNTYLFGKVTEVDDILRNAYMRTGTSPDLLNPLIAKDALFSLNLQLSVWMGMRINLWEVQRQMFQLYDGQATYILPDSTVELLEVSAIKPARLNIGGTPIASSGTASNPFLPANTDGCIQTSANGWIGYDYGAFASPSVWYVGIQAMPLATAPTYSLNVEYSLDTPGWDANTAEWITLNSAPVQVYPQSKPIWIVVEDTLNARAWRIRETGGATLKIQQLYFSQPLSYEVGDRTLQAYSREDYMNIANKQQTDLWPGAYYFNQKNTCTMTLWPVPNPTESQYTAILYNAYRYPQDITSLRQRLAIPPIFYDAACASLALRLYKTQPQLDPTRLKMLENDAAEAYNLAAQTNAERVPIYFTLDMQAYT